MKPYNLTEVSAIRIIQFGEICKSLPVFSGSVICAGIITFAACRSSARGDLVWAWLFSSQSDRQAYEEDWRSEE